MSKHQFIDQLLIKADSRNHALITPPEAVVGVINSLADTIHHFNAKWWHDLETGEALPHTPDMILSKLMLAVTEVAEAAEGVRKDLNDDHLPHRKMVEVEIADAIIRLFDLGAAMGLDIGGALVEKCEYNITRADHSTEARKATNGKKA